MPQTPAADTRPPVEREIRLQRLVMAYILTGLIFMLLPGTFLGVWNLLAISSGHSATAVSPAWIQAHGHAQIFGWIGTFILGIGFYSLSKMGGLPPFAIGLGWLCGSLWTLGVSLRWFAGVTEWQWRALLPISAVLELGAFLLFFSTVSRHRAARTPPVSRPDAWMRVVVASTFGFLLTLVLNLVAALAVSLRGDGPAIPHILDQRLLILATWGFLIPTVWGFNARWLPIFLGLEKPRSRLLWTAVSAAWISVVAAMLGAVSLSMAASAFAAIAAALALRVFTRARQPAKTQGVHTSFPAFVRLCYVWLIVAAVLSIWAARAEFAVGIWGASRHALTVGFLAAMVFAIGQRILPAFCGARVLFSRGLMFASLLLLNIGCALRVSSEIPAYEGMAHWAWAVLPVSALIEMAAVTLFAANLAITFLRPPAHLLHRDSAAARIRS